MDIENLTAQNLRLKADEFKSNTTHEDVIKDILETMLARCNDLAKKGYYTANFRELVIEDFKFEHHYKGSSTDLMMDVKLELEQLGFTVVLPNLANHYTITVSW